MKTELPWLQKHVEKTGGSSVTIKRSVFWTVHALCTLSLLIALILLLSGCAAPRKLERTQAVILMELHDTQPDGWAMGQVGQWRSTGAVHQVDILKSAYPECIEHEIRHVFEGDWHEGRAETCR